MINPWVIVAILVAWIGSMAGAYGFGRHVMAGERDSQMLEAVNRAVEHANDLAEQDYAAAASAWDAASARQKASAAASASAARSIETKIEYRACALDAADLTLLNNALEPLK